MGSHQSSSCYSLAMQFPYALQRLEHVLYHRAENTSACPSPPPCRPQMGLEDARSINLEQEVQRLSLLYHRLRNSLLHIHICF